MNELKDTYQKYDFYVRPKLSCWSIPQQKKWFILINLYVLYDIFSRFLYLNDKCLPK